MAETSTTPSSGFSIYDMLANPDFQRLLANIGTEMVPEGYAGNVIGKAATTLIKSKAAAKAGEQTLNEDDAAVTSKLGPLTPKGTQGPNKISRKPNGSLDLDVDHPNADALVTTLGGYSPLGTEGVNSVSRKNDGSLLVNYDPPRRRPLVSDEVDALAAAPTAVRDRTNLSYSPISQNQLQSEIDDTLSPFAMRRRSL